MRDWNVVISLYQDGFPTALRVLRNLGQLNRALTIMSW